MSYYILQQDPRVPDSLQCWIALKTLTQKTGCEGR